MSDMLIDGRALVPALWRGIGQRWLRGRFGPWLVVAGVFLLVSLITRLALLVQTGRAAEPGVSHLLQIFLLGLSFDLVAISYFLLPLVLFLILFNAAAEWIFWDEFGSRYNFIAVDYLLYTHEVIGNIRESYPVGLILGLLGGLSAAIAWGVRHAVWASTRAPSSLLRRVPWLLGAVLIMAASFAGVDYRLKELADNRFVNALSGNGVYEFFAAAYNNQLDYASFYRSLPIDEAFARLRRQLPTPHARLASHAPRDLTRIVAYPGSEKRLNVVLISVESLSAEFMTRFGNQQGLTPNLDRLAREGLLFTRLYANGTRTVRGLEALALSVPPTPGQSIVKRPDNGGLFSLGEVFRSKGYEARYVYGGYGYFDNMNAFFGANGYQVVDRTAIPASRIHHENIWGVADEDLFSQALEEADKAHAAGKPSFMHIMTTSNHRPYTYPAGRIDIPSHTGREGGVKYTDWAIGQFIGQARSKPWFDDTLFVLVADHCAASAGKTDLPVNRYHIPALFYSPKHIQPAEVSRLASQIDLAPTLLGLLKFSYTSRFLGYDLFDLEPGRERAFIGTYQDLGFLRGDKLVKLDSRRGSQVTVADEMAGNAGIAAQDAELVADAVSWYQASAWAYNHGGLRWQP